MRLFFLSLIILVVSTNCSKKEYIDPEVNPEKHTILNDDQVKFFVGHRTLWINDTATHFLAAYRSNGATVWERANAGQKHFLVGDGDFLYYYESTRDRNTLIFTPGLHAIDLNTGADLWEINPDYFINSLRKQDQILYLSVELDGAFNQAILTLDARTGKELSRTLFSYMYPILTFEVFGNMIFYVTHPTHYNGLFVAFDFATKTEKWKLLTSVTKGPNYFSDSEIVVKNAGKFEILNRITGNKKFSFKPDISYVDVTAYSADKIFVSWQVDDTRAFSKLDGSLLWKSEKKFYQSLLYEQGRLFARRLAPNDNLFVCMNANTGKEMWSFSSPYTVETPVLIGNQIYFKSLRYYTDKIIIYDANSGKVTQAVSFDHLLESSVNIVTEKGRFY